MNEISKLKKKYEKMLDDAGIPRDSLINEQVLAIKEHLSKMKNPTSAKLKHPAYRKQMQMVMELAKRRAKVVEFCSCQRPELEARAHEFKTQVGVICTSCNVARNFIITGQSLVRDG